MSVEPILSLAGHPDGENLEVHHDIQKQQVVSCKFYFYFFRVLQQ